MIKLNVKNTYGIKIAGAPSNEVETLSTPATLGLVPSSISFTKPKLLVAEGDKVQVGTPIYFDKQDDRIKFLSPGAGKVISIEYGPRRRLDKVVIELDKDEKKVEFKKWDDKSLAKASRDETVHALLEGGLWALLKELPFRRIPNPDNMPPSIYVTIDNDEPFLPQSEVYLKDNWDKFKFGIKILEKLAPVVHVGVAKENSAVKTLLKGSITHELNGAYPANDPGVFVYYNKKTESDNKAWYIKGQDVLLLASLFQEGVYPTDRTVSLGGTESDRQKHFRVRLGAPIASIVSKESGRPVRYIAGGVLTGRKAAYDDFLGLNETAVNMIPEGKEAETFYFFRPGFNKATFSKTYLSALLPESKFEMTTNINGGERSCIACSHCVQVCPTGVLPQFVYKSLKAGDIEDAIQHGLLDCAECGLCSYVCPSKIELDHEMKVAKAALEKETR